MKRIMLINPNIVTQKNDLFGSGIPYWPIDLAYLAAKLSYDKSLDIKVIDSFGLNPFKIRCVDDFYYQGLTPDEVADRMPQDIDLIVVYAGRVVMHQSLISIIKTLKSRFSSPIVVIENTQAVTSYNLEKVSGSILDAGADFILSGEPEQHFFDLLKALSDKTKLDSVKGIAYRKDRGIFKVPVDKPIQNLDDVPFPAWHLFPVENYWKLKYSHGPLTSGKYFPLLTSRGCPFACNFCVVPSFNKRRWRSRSPKNVVDEMEHYVKKFDVSEFHLEDLNPTIDKTRIKEICQEIMARGLDVRWKIASGTKIETIDKDTIAVMARAGCNYISMSPESGSKRVLDLISKPFDHDYAVEMLQEMNRWGIVSQACFVLGFPGESIQDLILTKEYLVKLAKLKLDEVALFIITPVPGSVLFDRFEKDIPNLNQLTFSPKWRPDYRQLHKFRTRLYLRFLVLKLIYNPSSLFRQILGFFSKKFYTKMEMTVYRAFRIRWMAKRWRL